MIDCDVLVIGGGPAGSSLALSLARTELSVKLIERSKKSSFKVGESLIPSVNSMLKGLKVWNILSDDEHLPSFSSAASWGSPALIYNDFIHQGQSNGWHLDRRQFDHQLLEEVKKKNVSVLEGCYLENVSQDSSQNWLIDVQKDKNVISLRARFIADCSGRLSAFTNRIGVQRIKIDSLIALWGVFSPNSGCSDQNATAVVEAEEDGWWHQSLLPSGDKIVSLFTDFDHPNINDFKKKKYFLSKLKRTSHISKSLENYTWKSPIRPHGESAESSRLQRITGPNWLAVGDAAMTFDPMSSQGIPNALFSGIEAARALTNAFNGQSGSLDKYEQIMEGIWSRYLVRISDLYKSERRWPQSHFWSRRLRGLNS
jgi:flavin-dependent dehydrogenase